MNQDSRLCSSLKNDLHRTKCDVVVSRLLRDEVFALERLANPTSEINEMCENTSSVAAEVLLLQEKIELERLLLRDLESER
ncbi:Hypothetical protein, putative [Bodo saltans]|uniref:Uncharacterized protein n=1 Tax=Bodo saltans TaxID=75058 RepID=A0A0S4J8U6_BODSA|nr:Hypothetical protein, putative [Bodo saltans]|eukprot:CUG87913.1 Hypothetical protein, putative [Bodo saltans]